MNKRDEYVDMMEGKFPLPTDNCTMLLTLSIMIKTLKQMAFVSWLIKFTTCYFVMLCSTHVRLLRPFSLLVRSAL